ncbi:protein of unknown function DUF1737 [Cryptosporangium arvum DSM 44712]|jgi:hypothetical protein|uniref:DUF1737 domain-containing protein n=1 Tax=Cryptosporangium arvum DSM 44712 TaxID=927661 RepID=A0A010YW21_9ACTN|nr:DUF1737 domain-containing protein [Cryptosporangium arvum]EXG79333.1 protein of unknown function DUF1737 [Cryptosporangium arvum DSM 44712]
MDHTTERLRYILLTAPNGDELAARVSEALDEGYELYGSPAITFDGEHMLVAQAVVLPAYAAGRYRRP